MTLRRGLRWLTALVGLLVAFVLLFMASLFVADRQLAPNASSPELGPVTVPGGGPAADGALLYASDESGNFEIYMSGPDAEPSVDRVALTSDSTFDSWRPRLSPDRRTVLFYRTPAGVADSDLGSAALWMVAANGGDPVEVLPAQSHGWVEQGHAEWSPVGEELVMMGGRPGSMQIWVTSRDGRAIRNLLSGSGDYVDPSWSPDSKRVLYSGCVDAPCDAAERDVFAVFATGEQEPIQITDDNLQDAQPQFSPDGRRIVMRTLTSPAIDEQDTDRWQIRIVPVRRGDDQIVIADDGATSESPMWRDGDTVVFHRTLLGAIDTDVYSFDTTTRELSVLADGPANERDPS